jgi:hypothetical protein
MDDRLSNVYIQTLQKPWLIGASLLDRLRSVLLLRCRNVSPQVFLDDFLLVVDSGRLQAPPSGSIHWHGIRDRLFCCNLIDGYIGRASNIFQLVRLLNPTAQRPTC